MDVPLLYEEIKIITLTGWPLEYVHKLPLLYHEAILQIYDAERNLSRKKAK